MKAIERVMQYIDYKGINKAILERQSGVSNGYLGKQYDKKADMGESILLNILENCPDINPEWLLTGRGRMLRGRLKSQSNTIHAGDKSNVIGGDVNGTGININELSTETIQGYHEIIKKQQEQMSELIEVIHKLSNK